MLEALSGIVTLALLVLSVVIGLRLLRMARWNSGRPEAWLGLYFLIYSALATSLSVGTYLGWSSAQIALSDGLVRSINAAFFFTSTVGLACLLIFTQRTFRPDSQGARVAVWGTTGVLAGSAIALGLTEGFEIRVLNGPPYWICFAARIACWVWVAAESFAYWAKLRRRLELGLADPVVANRFLLWGVWGSLMTLMAFSDPLARLWYVHLSGTTTAWVPMIGRPIIQVVVPLSCFLNISFVAILILTFFPTPGYRRWVQARAPKLIVPG
jgi:hypothetical protein